MRLNMYNKAQTTSAIWLADHECADMKFKAKKRLICSLSI